MKTTTLVVLGGLLFAGTSIAAEPQQATATSSSLKVAIDAKTGQLRTLTEAESAALDAMQAASAKTAAASRSGVRAKGAAFPQTDAEVQATVRVVNGITVMKPPASSLSSITVTRNADGTLQFQENGEPMTAHAQEVASE